jgi:hypothetical protein
MPREKKYLKLEAGERKAVRLSGAKRVARKTGVITNIYSGEKGALWNSRGSGGSNSPNAISRRSVKEVETKRQVSGNEAKEYNNEAYRKQGLMNQAAFEKTRLGSRIVKKADRAIARKERKGEDVEMIKAERAAGIRANASRSKQIYDTKFDYKKVPYKRVMTATKEQKAKVTAEQKKENKMIKKEEKSKLRLSRAEAAGARKNARSAKRNS